MTADVEMLPLPEVVRYTVVGDIAYPVYEDAEGQYVDYDDHVSAMHAYARANVAHATAARDAEVEALRAEVERLRAKTACTMGAGRGDGSLFVHGDYESIKAAQALVLRSEQAEAHAERLAEALRRYGVHDQACVAANIPICTCGLDAALEQEAGRG